MPDTLVTDSVDELTKFKRETGDLIYKPFSGIGFGAFETRPMLDEDLSAADNIKYAPPIVQKHVVGEFDIRATVIGRRVLSAKILYHEGNHPVDSRSDIVPTVAHDIPHDVASALVEINKRLGIAYGAFDLRYSDSTGYTFFEVNPAGQYLWIEMNTGLPISRAIALELLSHPEDIPSALGVLKV